MKLIHSILLTVIFALGVRATLQQQPLTQISFKMDSTPIPEFVWKEGQDIFSPNDLISLGRPGSAIPNEDGDLALVPFSQFDLDRKMDNISFFVVQLGSQLDAKPLQIPLEKGGEVFWLDSRTIANAVAGSEGSEGGGTELHALTVSFDTSMSKVTTSGEPQLIGTFPTASPANVVYNTQAGYLVFSEYVYEDGNLKTVREQDEAWKPETRGTTGMVYDSTSERHWDKWRGPKHAELFSIALSKEDGKWKLGNEFHSPLRGTGHACPVEPWGAKDDFDVSESHIVYTAKDPQLPLATHTKQNVYIVDIKGKSQPRELTSGKQGATHSPVFSTAGTKVAWLELDQDGYESDRAKIVIYDLEKNVRFTVTQPWDRSPNDLAFSKDDAFLYFTAGDQGRVKVFALPVAETPDQSTTHPQLDKKYSIPVALTHAHAAGGVTLISGDRLLFTQSSFVSPKDVFVIHNLSSIEQAILAGDTAGLRTDVKPSRLTHLAKEGLDGKHMSEGDEFWFEGANGRLVQGWALKPQGWEEGKEERYPGLLIIHGGPQVAWQDEWSTRWNPNVFANQGYFTIIINPTGSTTFGQEFTDAIAEDWGGAPFVDQMNGWKFALQNFPEIDPNRAVAAGGSWGGYAINWIQGHPEYGFNFKALICHAGVFDSNYSGYSTDELYFNIHDWGGQPWEPKTKELLKRMSPANFVQKWSTPQLLLHGSKDYRLSETESIGAFHALQQLGVPSRLVIFPDENHYILKHGNSLKWHYEIFRWFDHYVGEGSNDRRRR